MVVPSPGRLFVCGTNSFRPMCNTYVINDSNYTLEATKNGQAVCPYDPRHNSTSVLAGKWPFYSYLSIYCSYALLVIERINRYRHLQKMQLPRGQNTATNMNANRITFNCIYMGTYIDIDEYIYRYINEYIYTHLYVDFLPVANRI